MLLKAFDYTVRLPRPSEFTRTFAAAFEARMKEFPNFGASGGGVMTAEDWWAPVYYKTYLDLGMPKEDIDEVFADVFDDLYYDALTSPLAWEVMDDVLPVSC